MTRKQAKRRRRQPQSRFELPSIPWRALSAGAVAVAVIALSYHFSAQVLDRPISAIRIEGPFQRVSALQIEEAIDAEVQKGFLSASLVRVQQAIVALPWIDSAKVARRWPASIEISVTEQIPAATWGESGLLNTRGELFVTQARHVPAELPKLSGPDGQYPLVAARYLEIRDKLIPIGLDMRRLQVDARGAWEMTLANGIDIRLGRRDVAARIQLFLNVATNIISQRGEDIDFVDMRYVNGFTIGWKNGSRTPLEESESDEPGMLAGILR
ncbi:MAG: cell division protein FtsQ/DivIB [Woeseiaceae bacterium]|nr:cell division protein FtsQ/DivIB [Woeseiaceae bacterium]